MSCYFRATETGTSTGNKCKSTLQRYFVKAIIEGWPPKKLRPKRSHKSSRVESKLPPLHSLLHSSEATAQYSGLIRANLLACPYTAVRALNKLSHLQEYLFLLGYSPPYDIIFTLTVSQRTYLQIWSHWVTASMWRGGWGDAIESIAESYPETTAMSQSMQAEPA